MRAPPLWLFAVVVLCLMPAACTNGAGDPSSPVPGDAAEAAAPPAGEGAAAPFDLRIERIAVVGMDNAEIVGRPATPADAGAAERAVAGARDALAAFLNAQFVSADTQFSAAPIERLLSPRAHAALRAEDRAGLGEVDLPVARTVTGPASAVAQVLVHGAEVDQVTLTYDALLTVVLSDGASVGAKQFGAITFLPTPQGWRADAVEVTTELPGLDA